MISKQKIKFICSLRYNKYRLKHNCFIVEGEHLVNAFINSDFEVDSIFGTKSWCDKNKIYNPFLVSIRELKRISCLKNPSNVLAVISKPNLKSKSIDFFSITPNQ